MIPRDTLNLMHLANDLIVAGTELMEDKNPRAMDLQLIAIDLETAARKIRLYANSIRPGERGW